MTEVSAADILNASAQRRAERRRFLQLAGGSAVAVGGLTLLAACGGNDDDDSSATPTPTPTPTPTSTTGSTEANILNYALNLEYLEAQFYSFATSGQGLPASLLTGTRTQGGVTGGAQVPFSDPIVAAYAREIAADERAHVAFLRAQLGTLAVAQPAINIDGGATGAFTVAARAAGLIGGSETFNPYANDENFLLAAFLFEDVGVTAYKAGAPLLTTAVYREAAAGILAAEAYHAGLVRTVLYAKGLNTASLRTSANRISNARDSLDGSFDLDQGITEVDASGNPTANANITPADSSGVAFSRSPAQVHNIVYLNTGTGTSRERGGFFPAGTNNADPALTVGL